MTEPHERWFASAQDDLEFASVGLEQGYYAQVCFLAQQVSEKALKAVLIAKTGTHPRIHHLVALLNACAEHAGDILQLEDVARILDQYYIPSRYPDGVPGSGPEGAPAERNAREALEGARRILGFCRDCAS